MGRAPCFPQSQFPAPLCCPAPGRHTPGDRRELELRSTLHRSSPGISHPPTPGACGKPSVPAASSGDSTGAFGKRLSCGNCHCSYGSRWLRDSTSGTHLAEMYKPLMGVRWGSVPVHPGPGLVSSFGSRRKDVQGPSPGRLGCSFTSPNSLRLCGTRPCHGQGNRNPGSWSDFIFKPGLE